MTKLQLYFYYSNLRPNNIKSFEKKKCELHQGCLCPPIVLQVSSQTEIGGQMEDITGGHGGHTGGHLWRT